MIFMEDGRLFIAKKVQTRTNCFLCIAVKKHCLAFGDYLCLASFLDALLGKTNLANG